MIAETVPGNHVPGIKTAHRVRYEVYTIGPTLFHDVFEAPKPHLASNGNRVVGRYVWSIRADSALPQVGGRGAHVAAAP